MLLLAAGRPDEAGEVADEAAPVLDDDSHKLVELIAAFAGSARQSAAEAASSTRSWGRRLSR